MVTTFTDVLKVAGALIILDIIAGIFWLAIGVNIPTVLVVLFGFLILQFGMPFLCIGLLLMLERIDK